MKTAINSLPKKLKNHNKKKQRRTYAYHIGPYELALGTRTFIMGIVNCTPDSFSNDGCSLRSENPLNQSIHLAKKMIKDGADFIDVGGESTRPGSKRISQAEEIKRTIPTVKKLCRTVKVPVSIDTYKPNVAKHALDNGATIVNNIMGTRSNLSLLKMIRNYDAGIVLMHIKGTPRTMQKRINYNSLIDDMIIGLRKSIENCLEIGIKSDKIIIDPGIGFGKTVEHNLDIINHLEKFQVLKRPLLIGTSRKSFIGKTLNKEVDQRLFGSIASVCASVQNGAHIVRVHDVKQTKDAVTMIDAINNQ